MQLSAPTSPAETNLAALLVGAGAAPGQPTTAPGDNTTPFALLFPDLAPGQPGAASTATSVAPGSFANPGGIALAWPLEQGAADLISPAGDTITGVSEMFARGGSNPSARPLAADTATISSVPSDTPAAAADTAVRPPRRVQARATAPALATIRSRRPALAEPVATAPAIVAAPPLDVAPAAAMPSPAGSGEASSAENSAAPSSVPFTEAKLPPASAASTWTAAGQVLSTEVLPAEAKSPAVTSPGTSPAPLADAGAPAAAAAFAFPTPAANLPRSPWEALAVPLADRTAPSAAPSFSPATAEAVTLIASPASTDAATDSNLAVAASDTLLLSSSELSASAPEARRSPRAREENFAARAEKIGCEKISARSALPKTFLNPPEKRVTSGDPDLGIGVAKPATDMPAATFANRSAPAAVLVHTAAASVAVAAPDLLARSAPLLASDAPSTAQRAVDAVLTATDRFAAGDRHAVNLQFFVGGADLAVRVELRANEVRATFRTDSAELRTALAHEWQAVSGDATDRPVRLAPPVFTSSSGDVSGFAAFTGDNASRQRDSAPRRASEEIFATIASRSRAVSSATGEPDEVALPISRFASLPTSLHLHTLA